MQGELNSANKRRRGFAAMNSEKQKEIARKGGRVAHERGVAHKWNSDEAREAGKKGGQARKKSNYELDRSPN